MTAKIMISVSDDLKAMIDEYNKNHMFKKLHVSEICQEAIYNAIIGSGDCCNISVNRELKNEPVSKEPVSKEPASNRKQLFKDDSDKPLIRCPICGKEFVQTIPIRKYCSKNCATTASKRRIKASI